jgi:hypothetical protein
VVASCLRRQLLCGSTWQRGMLPLPIVLLIVLSLVNVTHASHSIFHRASSLIFSHSSKLAKDIRLAYRTTHTNPPVLVKREQQKQCRLAPNGLQSPSSQSPGTNGSTTTHSSTIHSTSTSGAGSHSPAGTSTASNSPQSTPTSGSGGGGGASPYSLVIGYVSPASLF